MASSLVTVRGNPKGGVLDPQIKKIMDSLEAQGLPPIETMTPEEAREGQPLEPYALPQAELADITERNIPGPAGKVRVRVYTPEGNPPFPVLVFVHGGGWVCCDLDTHDEVARFLCREANYVGVSVDYRRAPEHKFPAGLEDVMAVLQWARVKAGEINGDPDNVAIGGDSAGANLSLGATLMARDAGMKLPVFLLLIYPVVDISAFKTGSHEQYREGYFLTRTQMEWFKGHYLRSASDSRNPYVSPLLARNFRGLPPAYIMTAEFDPLRDEAEALAEKMHKAGIPVTCTRYNGAVHAFVAMAGAVEIGKEALEEAAGELKKALYKD